ncbi:MAG: AMP-binding protein [Pseudomonadota bacterium]
MQRLIQTDRRFFHGKRLIADYAAFDLQARRVAAWLVAHHLRPGDRVEIFMRNDPAYLILLNGIWYAGGVAVPINAKLHSKEAAFIIADSGSTLVFAAASLALELERQEGLPPVIRVPGPDFDAITTAAPELNVVPRQAEDMAWLFYTSGTTGRPKGVIITHGMLMSMALCYETDVDRVQPQDATLYAAPLSHGAGLYNLMHVRRAARHVIPASGGFDPAEIFDLAAHFREIHMFAAPTMVKRLTEYGRAHDQRGTGLRSVTYAGGPMYTADILAAVCWFGQIFVQIYGQGECPMGITASSKRRVYARGVVLFRLAVTHLSDKTGEPLGTDITSFICFGAVRAPST